MMYNIVDFDIMVGLQLKKNLPHEVSFSLPQKELVLLPTETGASFRNTSLLNLSVCPM